MKITVTENMFRDYMKNQGFSYNGLKAMYYFFEEVSSDMELDPIALGGDFTEFSSAKEAVAEYSKNNYSEKKALEYLNDNTTVIPFKGGIIIQNF